MFGCESLHLLLISFLNKTLNKILTKRQSNHESEDWHLICAIKDDSSPAPIIPPLLPANLRGNWQHQISSANAPKVWSLDVFLSLITMLGGTCHRSSTTRPSLVSISEPSPLKNTCHGPSPIEVPVLSLLHRGFLCWPSTSVYTKASPLSSIVSKRNSGHINCGAY